jgi:hypothetical protein
LLEVVLADEALAMLRHIIKSSLAAHDLHEVPLARGLAVPLLITAEELLGRSRLQQKPTAQVHTAPRALGRHREALA